VNFNGTGTVSIRDSGNVSSITDNGTGDYTVNFSNAMPDGNYSITGSGSTGAGGAATIIQMESNAGQTTNYRIEVKKQNDGARSDSGSISVSIFR